MAASRDDVLQALTLVIDPELGRPVTELDMGRDVEIDLVSAHKWFNLAAMRGNDEAKRYRMEVAREMSKAEIAEAQRQAREWLSRH
jgi:TPR repeat protein